MRLNLSFAAGAVLAFSALTSAVPTNGGSGQPVPKFVVFGDSFTDDGHGLYAISNNMLPPSPPYYAGRVSNGPVWPEQLVPEGVDMKYDLKDVAIAGAAAGTSPTFVQNVFTGQVYNIPNVHQQIKKYVDSDEFKSDNKAWTVYGIFIGVNDYGNQQAMGLNVTTADIVNEITSATRELADFGVKNIVVLNLPPVYRWPAGAPFASTPKALIDEHNASLKKAVEKLNHGARVELIDTHGIVTEVLDNPKKYGFENTQTTCLSPIFEVCAEPEKWFFWDAMHFTTRVHKLIGQSVGSQIASSLGKGKWYKSQ
jgi:phospholipase/lecithinase/hemolysin